VDVLCKETRSRAHRGGGATVGWRREFGVIAVGGGESSNGGWCCPEALLRLCKSEGEGEVRHTGFETGVTGEGSSPRCGHGGGSNFHGGSGSCDGRTAWRGLVGKCREGGTRRVKKACDGAKREEGGRSAPL
jgi:hypothetical protein